MRYYRPGMISLVFIPILFLLFLKMRFEEKDLRILKVNIPLPEFKETDSVPEFNYNTLEDIRKSVHFERFCVEDCNYADLDSLFKRLKERQKDSVFLSGFPAPFKYGLNFKFSANTSYEQFVTLVSLCQKYKYHLFAHDFRHDEFYVYERFDNSFSDTLLLCDLVPTRETKTLLQRNISREIRLFYQPVVESINKTWFIFLGFCYMTILSIGVFRNHKSEL